MCAAAQISPALCWRPAPARPRLPGAPTPALCGPRRLLPPPSHSPTPGLHTPPAATRTAQHPNRSAERRSDIIYALKLRGYDRLLDMSGHEAENLHFEGTGGWRRRGPHRVRVCGWAGASVGCTACVRAYVCACVRAGGRACCGRGRRRHHRFCWCSVFLLRRRAGAGPHQWRGVRGRERARGCEACGEVGAGAGLQGARGLQVRPRKRPTMC